MLIIGKNIRNQTTKNRGAYMRRSSLERETGLPGGQRPAQLLIVGKLGERFETTIFNRAYGEGR